MPNYYSEDIYGGPEPEKGEEVEKTTGKMCITKGRKLGIVTVQIHRCIGFCVYLNLFTLEDLIEFNFSS